MVKVKEDLTGKIFGRLTVICQTDDYVSPKGQHQAQWLCRCECGNYVDVVSQSLRNRSNASCGCYHKERCRSTKQDLTGKQFGRLTVLKFDSYKESDNSWAVPMWLCKCSCGKEAVIRGKDLKSGNTTSCGCYQKEYATIHYKKYNPYEIIDDYVIMYTLKGEPFYIDLDDLDKVKDICWMKDKKGYIVGTKDGKHIKLHRLITDCPDDMVVDHKNGSESLHDNRKSNLRLATFSQNEMNKKIGINNQSGVVGVYLDKASNKWTAQIGFNNKTLYLGRFDDFNDAVIARKQAEERYFGDFSRDNSRGDSID